MKKVAFLTLGCKVNAYETEAMQQQMESAGYEVVPFDEKADIYVINTCTVTSIADKKSRQMIRRAKRLNEDAVVVAAGCYVQADPKKIVEDTGADIVIGNDQKGRLAELVGTVRPSLIAVEDPASFKEYENLSIRTSENHTRAFMKIQDGCNQFCSYCKIPYVRGRERSRAPEEVVAEARRLADAGFREIVLTGIHLGAYGRDLGQNDALIDVIEQTAQIPGVERIRLGSLEPGTITDENVERLAAVKELCPHFHLSLQSACGATLKRMNRHYTPAEYEHALELLRTHFDHPAITTDVIAGFPGETEEEFAETLENLRKWKLYQTHIFKYSRRAGTRADRMPDQVPEEIKTERSKRLAELNEINMQEYLREYCGRTAEVLVEEVQEESADAGSAEQNHPAGQSTDAGNAEQIPPAAFLTGHTKEYVQVKLPRTAGQPGGIVQTIITPEMILLSGTDT